MDMKCNACFKSMRGKKGLCGLCLSKKRRYLKSIKRKGLYQPIMDHWSVSALESMSKSSTYKAKCELIKLNAAFRNLDIDKRPRTKGCCNGM